MANKLIFGRVQRFICNKGPFRLYSVNLSRYSRPKILDEAREPLQNNRIRRISLNTRRYTEREQIDPITYEKISDDMLDELSEYLEDCFQEIDADELDVNLSSGVLTISLGKSIGTYVINKQSPNRQIWLSSPISGPKRYDFVGGKWIYSHDGSNLHELLENEFTDILKFSFDMKSLDHYNFIPK